MRDQPIAAQIWFLADRRVEIFKLAHDFAADSLSVGTVLTAEMVRCAIDDERTQTLDFLSGDDRYKRLWVGRRRERWGLVAYRPDTATGLLRILKEAVARVVRAAPPTEMPSSA
jgi:CelD/BcsL family acetyltransferase involved in cellulose biosynthesis